MRARAQMSSAASTAVAAFVRPRVILGTMPFGQQVAEEGAEVILRQFAARHTGETRPHWELDTGTDTYHDWRPMASIGGHVCHCCYWALRFLSRHQPHTAYKFSHEAS